MTDALTNSIWKEYPVMEGDPPLHLALGSLLVWIQRKDEEIWIAHHSETDALPSQNESIPDDLSWSRVAHKFTGEPLSVVPVFPDLPIVVSSEFPLKVGPDTRIKIYTRIPVWMRISLAKSDYILAEIPSVELSKTWFGTPLEGELCYWSKTRARRSLSDVENKPYLVNCPIWITNKSEEDLSFEKFCYRVERLGIHRFQNELWAGETRISYHGGELNSDITMTGKLPVNMGKGQQLSKPRNPARSSLAARTFRMLFDDAIISAR